MQPNRRGFAEYAAREFATYAAVDNTSTTTSTPKCDQPDIITTLQPHQKVIAKYMKDHHGILVYHSLGSGKTCAAINSIVPGMHTIVMLKASIEPNFEKEITKCGPGILSPTFIHYNGLSKTIVQSFIHDIQTQPCFVIIDEVHNFVSAVINNPRGMQAKMHDALCRSDTVKIVALSGTPFINQPREVAFLINLVKGYTILDVYHMEFSIGPVTSLQIKDALKSCPNIDFVEGIDFKKNELSVRNLPGAGTDSIQAILLKKLGIVVTEHTKRYVQLVPQNEKDFNAAFIDVHTQEFINHSSFLRRIMGAVSYYGKRDPSLFPRTTKDELVQCEMSVYQAKKYAELRQVEIQRERMSAIKQFKTDNDGDDGQVYKTFSRISCNFVFPENIKRPFKSNTTGNYDVALHEAIEKVIHNSSALTKELRKHSCKFAAILDNLKKSPGSALVYSNYRRVEGITLLTEVLKANGFMEFDENLVISERIGDIGKDQNFFMTFDGQVSGPMLNVFNGNFEGSPLATRIAQVKGCTSNAYGDVIKVILVTQSGSEGINLLNVRQVHIMEPHWNNIRHDQVIGRAIRMCSHQALPEKDRTIEVYRYVAKLPKDMVVLKDGNKSTDELIMDIGAKKAAIIDTVLELLKKAAIDCVGGECFTMEGDADALAYDLDIINDVDMGTTTTKTKKYKKIEVKGVQYLMDSATNELYDWEVYSKGRGLRYAGKLIDVGQGVWVVL